MAVIHSTLQFDSEAFSSTLYARHLNRDLSPVSEGHHRFCEEPQDQDGLNISVQPKFSILAD